jgi:CheY-like chemotaxis protein
MFGRTKKEIRIHTDHLQDTWTVDVDRGQIEQVLLNLFVNAWQAMPGGGDLHLLSENVALDETYQMPYRVEPGRYVKLSVVDSGVGMDEATQKRIFEPFFTTKEMGRGTGLGLASAYGIIKNHGGHINVYSEKGRGTTFNIYLPASDKAVVQEAPKPRELRRGNETILLVDDEDITIEVGAEILVELGYQVITARNGQEALAVYGDKADAIDLVILDMIMPDMGGGRTYDELKKIDPEIKVLLSSGYSISGEASEILARGCNDFIQKPFNMKQLSEKMRSILDAA